MPLVDSEPWVPSHADQNARSSPVGSVTHGRERVVLIGHEEQIPPGSLGIGGHLGDALKDRALKVQLQHPPSPRARAGFMATEVQPPDMTGLEEVFQRWQRSRLARTERLLRLAEEVVQKTADR